MPETKKSEHMENLMLNPEDLKAGQLAAVMPITPTGWTGRWDKFMVRPSADPLSKAFDRKFTVHAGASAGHLPKDEVPATYNKLLEAGPGPLGLYVHIPFCHNQCLYCGFCGRRPERDLCADYVRALTREADWLKDHPAARGPVRTIYFGGGTPTVLEPADLSGFMDFIRRNFNLANDCEITLEGRLHDFTPEKAAGFLEAGFNRFSIGVQSFNTEIRRSLGRVSKRETVLELLGNLISHQKAAVIIDLIYGLPGQSPDDFVDDLRTAEILGIDGLDTYQLNVFPGSQLDQAMKAGRLPQAAPLSGQGEYYRRAGEYLLGRRWRQLSLSHFARTTRERNIYNPWAKTRSDCLALGAGAGGFLSGWSSYRMPTAEQYMSDAEKGCFLPDVLSPPPKSNALHSFVVGQMEQGYLNYRRLTEDFAVEAGPLLKLLDNWRENGLIDMDQQWLTMTLVGRFWGVNLTQAIIETTQGLPA